jgi:hypothetical protein
MLRSLSSSGAPHQQLLDVAHVTLLSRGLHAARVLRGWLSQTLKTLGLIT